LINGRNAPSFHVSLFSAPKEGVMARLFRRTRRGSQARTWYARFYVKGRRLARCLHTDARREAEHVALALEAENDRSSNFLGIR
jgi:hypothetical protein